MRAAAAGSDRLSPTGRGIALLGRLRTLIEENVAAHGLIYPWWIPVLSMIGLVSFTLVSLGIREQLWPPLVTAGLLALVTVPGVLQLVFGRHFSHHFEDLGVLVAVGWLLLHPLEGPAFDSAPALLAFLTAEVVARDGVGKGVAMAGVSAAMIVAAALGPGLHAAPVHLVDLALGFCIGYMLLWQMRALIAERAAREGEHARATLAERERIGREIHDLVAHALSVTLLQITGARRALRDVQASDRTEDVADIDAALADAERVGRQAIADIRQTVSTLAAGPAETHALPSAADIGALVDQMERAGLAIAYDEVGDPGRLADATGLGVYRIAQESLANIAKHAPAAGAQVRLTVTPTWARLQVRNPLDGAAPMVDGRGSGLAGMRARAEQLGANLVAGPDGEDWLVDLRLQLRERNGKLFCPMIRRVAW